jgi:hypothetical protein
MSEDEFRALVRELTGHNRHASAMWVVARHFGFSDLRKTFLAVRSDWRQLGQLTDEANAKMHAAFKEMRSRILSQHGAEAWARIPL